MAAVGLEVAVKEEEAKEAAVMVEGLAAAAMAAAATALEGWVAAAMAAEG